VGLNQPLHAQHNEGVGGCNEGNPNAAIRRLGTDRNEGGISNKDNKLMIKFAHCIQFKNSQLRTFLGFDVMAISSTASDRRKAIIEHITGDNNSTAKPNSNYKQ
jgi:hypothetical protein